MIMTTEALPPIDFQKSGAALLQRLALARAAAVARRGRYDDAADLLSSEAEKSAGQLDLLARVRAQKGRVTEAEALGKEAWQLAPGDARIAEALKRIRQSRQAPNAVRIAGTAAAVIASFGLGALWNGRPLPPSVPTRPAAVSHPAALSFDVPGVRILHEESALVARFDRPLFTNGARITPQGTTTLTLVAHALQPYAARIHVLVSGGTDGVPLARSSRYRDNDDLALARASAAARHLAAAGLPMSLLSIRSVIEPNAAAVRTGDKRTVVLYVIEKERGHGQ